MLPKASAYVKSYYCQTKFIFCGSNFENVFFEEAILKMSFLREQLRKFICERAILEMCFSRSKFKNVFLREQF